MNRINRNFARLLLACKRGNIILQNGLLRQFHRIGLSIAHKKGWFHPDGPEGWLGVINLTLDEEPFASLVAARINPEREIHRQQLLRLVDSALEDVIDNPPFEVILRQVRDWVADLDLMPGDVRAELVRRLSANLGVSLQQARTYMRGFVGFAQHNERVQNLITAFRAAVRDRDRLAEPPVWRMQKAHGDEDSA